MLIQKSELVDNQKICITGSKSISNRVLILQKLFGNIEILNLSNSEDTALLKKALEGADEEINIHHAGTAMRFLTSYFAICEGKKVVLTGSDRMKQRPIEPLTKALKSLGADIKYIGKIGFPPLEIKGKRLSENEVEIDAGISSQFLTSLILIGAKLENGLKLKLDGSITSRPYLEMTLKILTDIGIKNTFNDR